MFAKWLAPVSRWSRAVRLSQLGPPQSRPAPKLPGNLRVCAGPIFDASRGPATCKARAVLYAAASPMPRFLWESTLMTPGNIRGCWSV